MALIAITTRRKVEDYRQSVVHAGADVRIVEPPAGTDEALDGVDGLLMTGGPDVDPSRYGEAAHASVVDVDADRDRFEFALLAEARARHLPILAICRGIQILNVAAGGTLVQDIPSQVPGASGHQLGVPPNQPFSLAHEIWIEKGSQLARLMGDRLADSDTCDVNSRHHQAVKDVAPGFQVTATAPDGIIEAIEDPREAFCLGVQWHPENFWRTGEFRPLFEGLVGAAEEYGKRRSG
jgi:gamma-glutamyl-gamma-aminobutyrate hydrolase PuuD